jgi:hypothetical protein
MKTIDFLMSALAFSMALNVLSLSIAFVAVQALRNDVRREYAEKLKLLPIWMRKVAHMER